VSQLYLALGQGDKIIAGSDAIRLCVMWPSTPAERGEAEPEEEEEVRAFLVEKTRSLTTCDKRRATIFHCCTKIPQTAVLYKC
jgi:hypothetical protein